MPRSGQLYSAAFTSIPLFDGLRQAEAACTAVTARRMDSLVAGAVSGGSTRCSPTADTASRIAKKTEKGSSSGGSPTALLRWIESSKFSPSNSLTLKTGGQSLAVGIL